MKLRKIRTINTRLKDVVYKTDNNLKATEHFSNGKLTGITVSYCGKMKEVRVVFLPNSAFSNKAMKGFEGYTNWMCKYAKTIASLKDLDTYIPYLDYGSGHILFDINEKPISLPLAFDYIGSLKEKCSDDENYAKMISLLKKHPYILRLEEGDIPYYNRGFHGQKGISFAISYIPQKEYEKLYERFKGEEFWSVRMHDIIRLSYFGCDYGLYGEEIAKLLVKHYATEEQEDKVDDVE